MLLIYFEQHRSSRCHGVRVVEVFYLCFLFAVAAHFYLLNTRDLQIEFDFFCFCDYPLPILSCLYGFELFAIEGIGFEFIVIDYMHDAQVQSAFRLLFLVGG